MRKWISGLLCLALILAVLGWKPLSVSALSSGGWSYEFTENGLAITGYSGNEKDLSIPFEIGGYLVSVIGENAFSGRQDLTGVVIPEGVTLIEEGAFRNCRNLSSVRFLARNCRTSIENPEEFVPVFGGAGMTSPDGITVVFGPHVSVIPDCLFGKPDSAPVTDSAYVTSAELPESVREIGISAFRNCLNLEAVILHADETAIAGDAFAGCTNPMFHLECVPDSSVMSFVKAREIPHCAIGEIFVLPKPVPETTADTGRLIRTESGSGNDGTKEAYQPWQTEPVTLTAGGNGIQIPFFTAAEEESTEVPSVETEIESEEVPAAVTTEEETWEVPAAVTTEEETWEVPAAVTTEEETTEIPETAATGEETTKVSETVTTEEKTTETPETSTTEEETAKIRTEEVTEESGTEIPAAVTTEEEPSETSAEGTAETDTEEPGSPEHETETWTCINGHTGNTLNFCPFCGAPRPPKECPNCGFDFSEIENLSQLNFCPHCGTRISSGSLPTQPDMPEPGETEPEETEELSASPEEAVSMETDFSSAEEESASDESAGQPESVSDEESASEEETASIDESIPEEETASEEVTESAGEIETEEESESVSETEVESQSESATEIETEEETDNKTEEETESVIETEIEAETEYGSENETKEETESVIEIETEAETEYGSEIETEEIESVSEIETEEIESVGEIETEEIESESEIETEEIESESIIETEEIESESIIETEDETEPVSEIETGEETESETETETETETDEEPQKNRDLSIGDALQKLFTNFFGR